ncbi:hypothetical protein NDU88_009276 [Pleurodeles waltl]|uniref:Uncharacterized protein n=1 Tax=Pleurodeles waltl TaxID=8319 RepID=A0AAV7PRM3_PLEWA|nr:hypothetical protein NDU88_009276 [Pleurodeles waltl]
MGQGFLLLLLLAFSESRGSARPSRAAENEAASPPANSVSNLRPQYNVRDVEPRRLDPAIRLRPPPCLMQGARPVKRFIQLQLLRAVFGRCAVTSTPARQPETGELPTAELTRPPYKEKKWGNHTDLADP